MTVAEVRRGLDSMRRKWKCRGMDDPFYVSEIILNNMTMQEFGFKFVMGHHYKRHNKSKKQVDGEEEEEEDDGEHVLKRKRQPIVHVPRRVTRSQVKSNVVDVGANL